MLDKVTFTACNKNTTVVTVKESNDCQLEQIQIKQVQLPQMSPGASETE